MIVLYGRVATHTHRRLHLKPRELSSFIVFLHWCVITRFRSNVLPNHMADTCICVQVGRRRVMQPLHSPMRSACLWSSMWAFTLVCTRVTHPSPKQFPLCSSGGLARVFLLLSSVSVRIRFFKRIFMPLDCSARHIWASLLSKMLTIRSICHWHGQTHAHVHARARTHE